MACTCVRQPALAFHALGTPTFDEVQQVAQWTHARIEKVLLAHGRTLDGVGDEPPALTHEQRSDGYVIYRFKRAWRDGTHAVVLSPDDFIARLCALVPPPRFHLLRYFGVLAANASLRAEVVPKKPTAPPVQLPLFDECDAPPPAAKSAANKMAKPSRHPWAWLLRRVFAADVLVCVRDEGSSGEGRLLGRRSRVHAFGSDVATVQNCRAAPPRRRLAVVFDFPESCRQPHSVLRMSSAPGHLAGQRRHGLTRSQINSPVI